MMFKILYPRRIPERRNPVLVIATLCLCGLWLFTLNLNGAFKAGAQGFFVGMAVAVVPVAVYVPLALLVDRYEKEPRLMLAAAFLWGATAAGFFATILNAGGDASASGAGIHGVLGVPSVKGAWVEELIKAAALVALFFWQRYEFDNVIDGMVYAAMIGLGFAMTENVHFYVDGWEHHRLWDVVVGRGVLSPFSHPLFTAMAGIGLGVARETGNRLLKVVAPVMGVGAAILLHMEWNAFAELGKFRNGYLYLMLPTFIVVIGVVVYEQCRERKLICDYLHPYVARGDLTPEELETLCRFGGRLRALWTAMMVGGRAELQLQGCFQQAATELAFHRWRVARGISRGKLDDEKETEYLNIMTACRPRRAISSLSV